MHRSEVLTVRPDTSYTSTHADLLSVSCNPHPVLRKLRQKEWNASVTGPVSRVWFFRFSSMGPVPDLQLDPDPQNSVQACISRPRPRPRLGSRTGPRGLEHLILLKVCERCGCISCMLCSGLLQKWLERNQNAWWPECMVIGMHKESISNSSNQRKFHETVLVTRMCAVQVATNFTSWMSYFSEKDRDGVPKKIFGHLESHSGWLGNKLQRNKQAHVQQISAELLLFWWVPHIIGNESVFPALVRKSGVVLITALESDP